jgi:type IV fimbrial biogenesis protein FimT
VKEYVLKNKLIANTKESGFSLIELITVIAVLAILAAIAVPTSPGLISNAKLRSAARDIYSNLQSAKLSAIKQNSDCAVVFDNGVSPGRYFICSSPGANGNWDGPPAMGGDDVVIKTINLANYGNNIDYGSGNATNDIPGGGAPPGDVITYAAPADVAVFSHTGTVVNAGVAGSYVYLANNRGSSYGVGTPSTAGVVVLRRWTGGGWE